MAFEKNPAYKYVNSSSMTYIESPKKESKNPDYKNVNSSSARYFDSPPKPYVPQNTPVKTYYSTYCNLI